MPLGSTISPEADTDIESPSGVDPDKVLQSLFEKKNGRPLSAWNRLRDSFPEFTRKPLSHKVETLKSIAASIAYFRGAEALDAARHKEKVDYNVIQQFGICFDKVAVSTSDDLTVKIPARMLGSYSCAIILKPTPQPVGIQADVELRNENEIAK